MKLNLNKADWVNSDRAYSATKSAVEKNDFDSGWKATPSDKIVKHDLGVLPRFVLVFASDSANGDSYSSDAFMACTKTQVTITGPKAYCRVLAEK